MSLEQYLPINCPPPPFAEYLPTDWAEDKELKDLIEQWYEKDRERHLLRWQYATEYHRNDKNQPLVFHDKPYLNQIYADHAQALVFQKCVQVFASEFLIVETLSHCELGDSVFYVMPKHGLRNSFVKNRIQRSIQNVSYYKDMVKNASGESDSVTMLHFGKGVVFFASSESASDFDMFNADVAIIDDLHNCDPLNIQYTDDRLSASQHKIKRLVGIADYAGFGINAEFQKSDQKRWHVPCGSCGKHQYLDLFKNVCRKTDENLFELLDTNWELTDSHEPTVYCIHCNKPMDRLAVGEWVALTNSNVSGYHLSKIFTPNTTIRELWVKVLEGMRRRSVMQNLLNRDLGECYEDTTGATGLTSFERNIENYIMPSDSAGPCTMGMDVGKLLHIRISKWEDGKRRAMFIGTRRTFEEARELMERFEVQVCCMDMLPETRKAREFQAACEEGMVKLCLYPNETPQLKLEKVLENQENDTVKLHRTFTLDDLVDSYLSGESVLPVDIASVPEWIEQMQASKRIDPNDDDVGADGSKTPVWIHSKPDHYFHAENYDYTARLFLEEESIVRFL